MDYQIEKQITDTLEKVLNEIHELKIGTHNNAESLVAVNKNQAALHEAMGTLKEEFKVQVRAVEDWSEKMDISREREKKDIYDRFSIYEVGITEGMADFIQKLNEMSRKLNNLEQGHLPRKEFEQWQDNGLKIVIEKIDNLEKQLESLQSSSLSKESFQQWQDREGYNKFNSLVENFFGSLVKLDWRIWIAAGFVLAIATGLIGVNDIAHIWGILFGGE